jgi:hypothetical protein
MPCTHFDSLQASSLAGSLEGFPSQVQGRLSRQAGARLDPRHVVYSAFLFPYLKRCLLTLLLASRLAHRYELDVLRARCLVQLDRSLVDSKLGELDLYYFLPS